MLGTVLEETAAETGIQAALGTAARLGLEHVVVRPTPGGQTNWGAIKTQSEKNGLRVAALETDFLAEQGTLLGEEDRDGALHRAVYVLLETGRQLGSAVLFRDLLTLQQKKVEKHVFLEKFVREIRCLSQWSRELGVQVGVAVTCRYESQSPYTVRDMGMLLHELNCLNLGLAVDSFQMNIEESSMEATLLDWGRYVCHLYLHDNYGGLPGTGLIHFQPLLAAAAQACPQVPMTLEKAEPVQLQRAISHVRGARGV